MPMREFACTCGAYKEIYNGAVDPEKVPIPVCACGLAMSMLWSLSKVDTADTFHPFRYRGPDGIYHDISNLHKLRAVEHSYLATGHNVRFDAYSADPSNPDAIDGYGLPQREGLATDTTGKAYAFMK